MGKVVELQTDAYFADPKNFLRDLQERLERDYPKTTQMMVIIQYEPEGTEDGKPCYFATTSNHLTLAEKLWLVEQAKQSIVR